jgi:hypothetical protein
MEGIDKDLKRDVRVETGMSFGQNMHSSAEISGGIVSTG